MKPGITKTSTGYRFVVSSVHATSMTLCLFTEEMTPLGDYPMTQKGVNWSVAVQGLSAPFVWGYRADGPQESPHEFDPNLLLLDPYAKRLNTPTSWDLSDPAPFHPLGLYREEEPFDWQGVQKPAIPRNEVIIYEMHVRSFTQDPSSHVTQPGTYLGVIEKIPYLLELGINAVELYPVYAFNEREYKRKNPATHEQLCNLWGYSPISFFCPMNGYACEDGPTEFKEMVRELHRNGIEVYLDVVYNHTGEFLPYSFRGLDKLSYYIHDKEGELVDMTSCGSTFSCNSDLGKQIIYDSIHYWASDMQVDGFRFDLASVLTRDVNGKPMNNPPIIELLSNDQELEDIKFFVEAWDAGGLYHVGKFYPEMDRWSEWNGRYRDTVRRFLKGTPGYKGAFATALCGSEDLYKSRSPLASCNFFSCHDGFNLNDLVSYNEKHNSQNGEDNRDGPHYNDSWNGGIEGPTGHRSINELREKQKRNFFLALLISQGIPLILSGDEYSHTREGNNNPWCHDNHLNWFQWDELRRNIGLWRFVQTLISIRKKIPELHLGRFLTNQDITWHGLQPNTPGWEEQNHIVAFDLNKKVYVAFNSSDKEVTLKLPTLSEGKQWHLVIHTGKQPPEDCYEWNQSPPIQEQTITLSDHTAVMLLAL